MNYITIDSSYIRAVAHENGTLFVRVNNGKIFSYANVPLDLFEELISFSTESKGKFFLKHIKGYFEAALVGEEGVEKKEVAP